MKKIELKKVMKIFIVFGTVFFLANCSLKLQLKTMGGEKLSGESAAAENNQEYWDAIKETINGDVEGRAHGLYPRD